MSWVKASCCATLIAVFATSAGAAEQAREVHFTVADATIAGTLYAPGPGRHPALVLLATAGGGGRKEPMQTRINALIRQPLIERGYAVLAYDPQGVGESTGRPAVTIEEEAQDGVAACAFLRTQPDIDRGRIGLYGVSHGGWLAPIVAVKVPSVRAVVMVSTAAFSPLEQNFFARENMDYIAGVDRATAAKTGAIRRAIHTYLATGRGYDAARQAYARLDSDSTVAYFRKQVPAVPERLPSPEDRMSLASPYFRDATFDPLPWLTAMRQPAIVILGERDPLVDARRSAGVFSELAGRKPRWDLTVKVYPGAGHAIEMREERSPIHAPDAPRAAGHPGQMLDWLDRHMK